MSLAFFPVEKVDAATIGPKPISQHEPIYFEEAKLHGLKGYHIVEFLVETDGTTSEIEIVESSPNDLFAAAVVRAVSYWEYDPMRVDGIAIQSRVRTRLDYERKGWTIGETQVIE